MNSLLDQISNFFVAVINIYPQIPNDLHEQIKTMQAFLRSYDEKQLFLIQNFVRRLQNKADKAKHQHKKKRNDLKTEPAFFEENNKQNVYNIMNVYSHSNTGDMIGHGNSFKLNRKDKHQENQLNADINRYNMLFENYTTHSRSNSHILRPLSMPKQQTPSPPQLLTSRERPKLKSQPYIEASESQFENVNSSNSCIDPKFFSIQINHLSKRQENQGLEKMKQNAKEIRQFMQKNQAIKALQNLLD